MNTFTNNARLTLVLAAIVLLTLTGVPYLTAQTETGQITGTVLDAQGGTVTTATVSAVDNQTKTRRTSKSSSGVYVLPSLPTGTYEVTATAPGFETSKQSVTVSLGSKIGLDFHLNVGNVQTIVEVSETAPDERGDTSSGGGKPATLETGAQVQVPFHIKVGDKIKVDTRNRKYLTRV